MVDLKDIRRKNILISSVIIIVLGLIIGGVIFIAYNASNGLKSLSQDEVKQDTSEELDEKIKKLMEENKYDVKETIPDDKIEDINKQISIEDDNKIDKTEVEKKDESDNDLKKESESDDDLNKEEESDPYSELEPVFYNTIYGNEGAVNSAKIYLKSMAASKTKIISFLKKKGFNEEEATYGAENCGADWYDQALRMAMSYLNVQEFTYEQLALQLMIEGFTEDEIIYVLSVIYEASLQ